MEQEVIVAFDKPVTEKQQQAFDNLVKALKEENPNTIVRGIGGGIKNPPIK